MTTAATAPVAPSSGKGLHLSLWAVQGLLAFAFGLAGVMKMTAPIAELAKNMSWVSHSPEALVRFIGLSEFLGAVGLILPAATRIQPKLTPVAASLLVLVMVLGIGTHVMLGEAQHSMPALVLGGLSAFVAWGRFAKSPIAPRS